jgi:hypothetical protein
MIQKTFNIMHDKYHWLPGFLMECYNNDCDILIDFNLEGACHIADGLYGILDNFCEHTGYDPRRISIRTGNMIATHTKYQIERMSTYWYEVKEIQKWLIDNPIDSGTTPTKHFGHFVGRSQWPRLWMSAILDSKYNDVTLQTFHSGINSNYVVKEVDGVFDRLGLDDLVKFNCDKLVEVAKFLDTCPRVIAEDLNFVKNCSQTVIMQNDFYPIQHPANLNIVHYYRHIFLDIVNEAQILGNCFFITEKMWRPVVARRPFIVMGSRHFLSNLKKLGFKTFNNLWDEGYDEVSPSERIKEIEKLLETIAKWPVEKLHLKLEEMQDILDHNYDTFCSLTYDKIREVFQ